MRHPERDAIAGLVMGEPGDTTVADHLRTCQACRTDAEQLGRTAHATTRLSGGPVALERPPDHVWERIAGAVAESDTGPAFRLAAAVPGTRRRRHGALLAGCGFAVGVAATLAVVAVVDRSTPSTDAPPPVAVERILEQGVVAPIPAQAFVSDTQGRATIVQTGHGWELRVRLERPPQVADGYVQAWMLDPVTNAMVALGVLDGKDGTFAVPADLDLASYTSVDLSLEPFDGDPVHSAVSLARGPLTPLTN